VEVHSQSERNATLYPGRCVLHSYQLSNYSYQSVVHRIGCWNDYGDGIGKDKNQWGLWTEPVILVSSF
jgi:hypothetical protein